MIKNKDKSLTAKQRAFCQYYAVCNNGMLSAQKAGYSDRGKASKDVLAKDAAIRYISELRKQMIEEFTVQTEYCIMQWKKLTQMAISQGDYTAAANIVQKISKMKEPINAGQLTGQIKINIV